MGGPPDQAAPLWQGAQTEAGAFLEQGGGLQCQAAGHGGWPDLSGPLFHCVRLLLMIFITVIDP